MKPTEIYDPGIKNIFMMLVDISGYTRFIRYHKISLLHAEKIISELLESVLREVEVPVIAHEILGDAISFYSIADGTAEQADRIYAQVQRYFDAFRKREAELISSCSLCQCDACLQVGKLRLKAILHHGVAAFTFVGDRQKISGEDVIISHRLLKNTIPSKEYIMMTRAFAAQCCHSLPSSLRKHAEQYDDVGRQELLYESLHHDTSKGPSVSRFVKWRGFLALESYLIKRIFTPFTRPVLSIPEHPNSINDPAISIPNTQ